MKTFTRLRQVIFNALILSILATCVMISMLTFLGTESELKAEQWASWVQAVGSISAILISLGLTSYQNERQYRVERSREAASDLRIATFASAVVGDALVAVRSTERAQRMWPVNSAYKFHDQARIEAAQILTRTLATEPLFSELISPVMDVHALLVSVEASANQLIGDMNFKNNKRVTQLWDRWSAQMVDIEVRTQQAVELASSSAKSATEALRHF